MTDVRRDRTPRLPDTPRQRTAPVTDVLHIDWTACDGRGLCTELLDSLERDEWGYPLATDGSGSSVPIARGDRGAARDAVALCPLQASSIRRVR